MRQSDEAASSLAVQALDNNVLAVRSDKPVARGGDVDEPREGGQESVIVEKRGEHAAVCKWTIAQFGKVKARALWSKYFEVGGYDCRLLVYPKGDSQALPGYISIYLQVTDPRGTSSSKWDCFASYRLCVINQKDESKIIQRDSWHRFSGKKKSHGWCDFTPSSAVLESKGGFLINDSVLITAEILVLNEAVSFSRENELPASSGPNSEVLSGKFTWKVHNLSLFKEMIKTQKIMSPVFPAGECNLRLSVYQSSVSGVDYLSMCLESKDTEKSAAPERSCWCLFRMSVLNQRAGGNHVHRDSYGRFAADNKCGDNTSLGWNDYMKMSDFVSSEMGYLADDTAIFSASFHVIKESSTFSKHLVPTGTRGGNAKKGDGYQGKFVWRIDNFTRLKDLLKKRKITGLCIKSRRFQVGNRDCRLIVYPRGQSQPPCHLSMFLEVTDPRCPTTDWSCFVSHRLSVVNQRSDDRSVTKESQNRYSKAAKDWGWREFVTLTSLFDQDSGFLVADTVVFAAEVLILKETATLLEQGELSTSLSNAIASLNAGQGFTPPPPAADGSSPSKSLKRGVFTWRVENFVAFKEIMETRKIFSKFFSAGGCELRIGVACPPCAALLPPPGGAAGVYESFDTLCIYLESDQALAAASPASSSAGPGPQESEQTFCVRYRIGVVNQKQGERTVWKEADLCTRTWNNSVLQFMKASELLDPDAGFLLRDAVVFVCEILDCSPWLGIPEMEGANGNQVLLSDEEQDALSTDPDELLDSDESESGGISGEEEDIFRSLLARAGFHLSYGDNPPLLLDPSQLQVMLREKLLMDAGAVAAFLAGLRIYLDDPAKVKRLLLPAQVSSMGHQGANGGIDGEGSSPSLMNLLMGVKVLQQAIVDLLLDIMVECCQPSSSETRTQDPPKARSTTGTSSTNGPVATGNVLQALSEPRHGSKSLGTVELRGGPGASDHADGPQLASGAAHRLDRSLHGDSDDQAVQSSDMLPPVNSALHARSNAGRQDSEQSGVDVPETPSPSEEGGELTDDLGQVEGGPRAASSNHAYKPKWPEQADQLLALIVDSLRALEGAVPHGSGYPEPPLRRRPQSAQKISIVLSKAPRSLQGELLALLPRLVDPSEHQLAAHMLLERLRQPDAEPALHLPVLGALVQLEIGSPLVWGAVLNEAMTLLPLAEDDPLAAAVSFTFKAAVGCHQLPLAAKAVRQRLQQLGPAVSPRVLHAVRSAIAARDDVAAALLADIDADCDRCEAVAQLLLRPLAVPPELFGTAPGQGGAEEEEAEGDADGDEEVEEGANGPCHHVAARDREELQMAAQQAAAACWHVADVDMLVEVLTQPAHRGEAQRVFERAIARGAFGEQAIVMVLERRRVQRAAREHQLAAAAAAAMAPPQGARGAEYSGTGANASAGGPVAPPVPSGAHLEPLEEDEFPAVLGLAESLALSEDLRVREFVGTLYAVMFKVYGDEGYRERLLRGLVGRATSSSAGTPESELGIDILAFLVQEEGLARPVLGLMREAVEVVVAERGALWQQLREAEEELRQVEGDRGVEQKRAAKEKAALQSKLAEVENTLGRIKGELRAEMERGAREKREALEAVRDLQGQLDWACAEREEEMQRATGEKQQAAERLRDAEAQLSQLKIRKRDELKKLTREKSALAERLKISDSARKRLEDELKRSASEASGREDARASLDAEVQRLTQMVGHVQSSLREKEEQVSRCEAYIDDMESKLHAHQHYISTLEASLQEEMSRHAPLYGAGLEQLSMAELDTLAQIHEDGLKQVRELQHQRGGGGAAHVAPLEPPGAALDRSAPQSRAHSPAIPLVTPGFEQGPGRSPPPPQQHQQQAFHMFDRGSAQSRGTHSVGSFDRGAQVASPGSVGNPYSSLPPVTMGLPPGMANGNAQGNGHLIGQGAHAGPWFSNS